MKIGSLRTSNIIYFPSRTLSGSGLIALALFLCISLNNKICENTLKNAFWWI